MCVYRSATSPSCVPSAKITPAGNHSTLMSSRSVLPETNMIVYKLVVINLPVPSSVSPGNNWILNSDSKCVDFVAKEIREAHTTPESSDVST